MTDANIFVFSNKWEREILGITERELSNYYSVIKSIKEVKLKDFQYKVTSKSLATRSFLHKINRMDDNLCEQCHQKSKTIRHLFLYNVKMSPILGRFKGMIQGKNKFST